MDGVPVEILVLALIRVQTVMNSLERQLSIQQRVLMEQTLLHRRLVGPNLL